MWPPEPREGGKSKAAEAAALGRGHPTPREEIFLPLTQGGARAEPAEDPVGPPLGAASGWLIFCVLSIQYSGSRCACAMAKTQTVSPDCEYVM